MRHNAVSEESECNAPHKCSGAVAYFPSSSYSWYSSVNLVEVTIVAMLRFTRISPLVSAGAPRSGSGDLSLTRRVREEEVGEKEERCW